MYNIRFVTPGAETDLFAGVVRGESSMIRRVLAVIIVGLVVITAVAAPPALAHPRPSPVPHRWELRFEPGDLRLYVDKPTNKVYWYFTYKVTNLTRNDQIWAPEFTLFLDNGEILKSGGGVSAEITEHLLALLKNDFLKEQNELIGDIRTGAAHALEGLVIWPANDFEVSRISMFIAGISGDTQSLALPDGQSVLLRKTMERKYLAPGNVLRRAGEPMELLETEWIYR